MRIGSQTYIFMQHYARAGLRLEDHYTEALEQLAGAGFEGCELMLDHLADHQPAMAGALRDSGLALAGVYAGGNLHEPAAAEATIARVLGLAPRAAELGAAGVSFNGQPRVEPRKSDAELRRQADGLNALGEQLGRLGLALWVHTHDAEMVDQAREFRSLLDLTDPARVGLCLDTHWVHRGGGDMLALAGEYADRIGTLHVRQSQGGVWDEVFGPGDLAHEPLADLLRARGWAGWVLVELALEPGTPLERPLQLRLALSCGYARGLFSP